MDKAKVDRYSNPQHPIWWLLLLVPPGIVWYVFFRIWASNNQKKLHDTLAGDQQKNIAEAPLDSNGEGEAAPGSHRWKL